MSADREHCLEEKLLGVWTDIWLNLLAVAKTCQLISISIPGKSSVAIVDVFLSVILKGCHWEQ